MPLLGLFASPARPRCRLRWLADSLHPKGRSQQCREPITGLGQILVLFPVPAAGHSQHPRSGEPVPQTILQSRQSNGSKTVTCRNIEPKNDLCPHSIATLATRPRSGGCLHLEIATRYCEATIDLQIIHKRGSLIAIPIADYQPTRHWSSSHTVPRESPKPDVFPQTLHTWIDARLEDGQLGRLDVNNHIMTTYALPLRIYLLGSSWRRFGEADEIINGFFAGRLDKPDFFTQWQASGKRLRYWLINALRFHLQEQYRRGKRDHVDVLPDDPDEAKAHRDFDRAWAMSLIREACRDAQQHCAEEGLEDHWSVFHQHHVEGVAYRDIAAAMNISPGRCAVMSRTATSRFKQAMANRLQLDGTPDTALNSEIDVLLEAIQ